MKVGVLGMAMTAIIVAASPAAAQEVLSNRSFLNGARSLVGKKVRLGRIGCVDPVRGGFVCATSVGGQMLRINASVLGPKTSLVVSSRLLGDCKGTANIMRDECQFFVEIEPTNVHSEMIDTARGSLPMVVVHTGSIEMFASRPP